METTRSDAGGVTIGRLESVDGEWWASFTRAGVERRARPIAIAWQPGASTGARLSGCRVALGFEGNDPDRPVVLAILDPPSDGEDHQTPEVLRFDAKREVVLACGKAKVSLRADGRIVILGGYILSRSSGAQKIKGGSIQLN